MASMWRKAMLYLGLGPDDEYEEDGGYDDRPVAPASPATREPTGGVPRSGTVGRPRPSGRPGAPAPPPGAEPETSTSVRTLAPAVMAEPAAPAPAPSPRPVVRPVPATTSKPHVVSPTSFNQAQDVADRFKVSQPVILNLQGVERDLARRLIDFSSGLCYGLGGHMEKVAHQVYLLTPVNVEVSADERRRLQERGLHDG
jgi:cell division inhibitor SepF